MENAFFRLTSKESSSSTANLLRAPKISDGDMRASLAKSCTGLILQYGGLGFCYGQKAAAVNATTGLICPV
jgi:hypothetical protein